jgi:hypothetical protein
MFRFELIQLSAFSVIVACGGLPKWERRHAHYDQSSQGSRSPKRRLASLTANC